MATDLSGSVYSELDASNNSAPPDGWPAGMFPNQVEGAARQMMGATKRAYDRDHAGAWVTVGTSALALALTYVTGPTAYVQGEKYAFKAPVDNTGSMTANVQSLGPLLVMTTDSGLLPAHAVVANGIHELEHDGTQLRLLNPNMAPFLRGLLFGLTLSNDIGTPNTVLDIAAGIACGSTGAAMLNLPSAYTKNCNAAWAVGSGNGALDSGSSLGSSTWYHVWLIMRVDTGVVDILLSTSATAPTMPTSYTLKRRIGSIKTDGSSHILAFTQDGDYFRWAASVFEINTGNPGTSAVTLTLGGVPTGVNVQALFNCLLFNNNTAGNGIYFSDLAATDEIPTGAGAAGPYASLWVAVVNIQVSMQIQIRTNTSAQVRYRASGTTANLSVDVATLGWWDHRGRNA